MFKIFENRRGKNDKQQEVEKSNIFSHHPHQDICPLNSLIKEVQDESNGKKQIYLQKGKPLIINAHLTWTHDKKLKLVLTQHTQEFS